MPVASPPSPRTTPPRGLAVRTRTPELMDDPALDADAHRAALRALTRVHRVSRCGARFRGVLDRLFGSTSYPIRVLDIASGGGDLSLDIARWGRDRKRDLQVVGADLSPRALEFAEARARTEGLDIDWIEADVLGAFPPGPFDLAVSSLFLHHLEDADVVTVLRSAAGQARHIVVEDLHRSRLGFALAWGGLRLLSRAHVTHVDGPRSVRAAWRGREVEALAAEAGMEGARVRRAWPERLVLSWSRS